MLQCGRTICGTHITRAVRFPGQIESNRSLLPTAPGWLWLVEAYIKSLSRACMQEASIGCGRFGPESAGPNRRHEEGLLCGKVRQFE